MEWYKKSIEEVLKELESSQSGISQHEAEARLAKFGPNALESKKAESPVVLFLKQFMSPLIYILLFAAGISYIVGKTTNTIVILAVLFTNATMGFIQESRAKRTMESLRKLSAPKAKAIRDGRIVAVSGEEIVPGDVILLETGDRVPADSRIIESVRLQLDEASLTGESQPTYKIVDAISQDASIGDRTNMVFAGTIVTSGRGKAAVVSTGMNTEIGKIVHTIQAEPEVKTPFQRRMAGFGRVIIAIVSIQILLAFSVGYFVRGMPFYDIFLVAISQMVSSIPEGLPVAVTVALAVGMQRMARSKAYVRKLAAVEGLGSATVICSDKTGTLTRNEMTARRISTAGREIEITGIGYKAEGRFIENGKEINPIEDPEIRQLLLVASLCNNAKASRQEGGDEVEVAGDPTEIAYLVAGMKAGIDIDSVNAEYGRIDEMPFESRLQMMATKHRTPDGKYLVCVKGAPEKILDLCGHYAEGERKIRLGGDMKDRVRQKSDNLAKDALRVLAFCFAEVGQEEELDIDAMKGKLVFAGLIGNMDPPREEVKNAIRECKKAGIRTIMVTGDHLNTAEAVGRELEIAGEEKGITGKELEEISDEKLRDLVRTRSIFARVEPNHKFRIVKALQSHGEIVAVTGDGVNDASALIAADIGVAMGITGTDVAKEASSMVIADDNFATIVRAVEEGRGITANMRKTVLYLLCSSNTEILVLLVALIAGFPLPLLPLMILWINLVTDGALTVNLIMEPKEDVMAKSPDRKDEPIVTHSTLKLILFRASIMAIGIIGLFWMAMNKGDLDYARTVAFAALAVTQWMNGINCRSDKKSIFRMPFFGNRYLIAGLAAAVLVQMSVIYVPFVQQVFSTVPLSLSDWVMIVLVSSSVFWAEEVRKWISARKSNRQ